MGVLLAWLVEVGLITWRDLSGKDPTHVIQGFPLPADYLATFMVFGTLGLVPKDSPGSKAATLAAWAFVLATYMNALPNVLNPSNPSAPTTAAQQATLASGGTITPSGGTSSSTLLPGG